MMRKYYERIAEAKPHLRLIVDTVPTNFDAKWVKDQNDRPGILALAMKEVSRGEGQDPDFQGIPFVVPGARFNEVRRSLLPLRQRSLQHEPDSMILPAALQRAFGLSQRPRCHLPARTDLALPSSTSQWDSYFISLGLLADGQVELAKGIADHFLFEIKHYKKILNGNRRCVSPSRPPSRASETGTDAPQRPLLYFHLARSYYLMRSQPPFLTDLAVQVFAQLDPETADDNKAWLKRAIQGAIQEYHIVWQEARRLDPVTGLSRYRPDGLGVPPETEASHFTAVLQPYADKQGVSVNEFIEMYNDAEIECPELDAYFLHDRGVRESGHDTTYRFEKKCADLGTIDLCSLMYKYETDIATAIRDHFGGSLELEAEFDLTPFPFGTEVPYTPTDSSLPDLSGSRKSTDAPQTSAEWFARAARRKELADYYLWHDGRGIYVDWNCAKGKQSLYDSVTTFWPMWCGMASEAQAEKIMCVAAPSCSPSLAQSRRSRVARPARLGLDADALVHDPQAVLVAQVRGRRRARLGDRVVARPHLAPAPQPAVGVRPLFLLDSLLHWTSS